jgi:ribosomal protein L20
MPRVTRGIKRRKRRSKILKLAKGFWGARGHNYKTAKEAVEKSLQYSYRDSDGSGSSGSKRQPKATGFPTAALFTA